MTKVRTEYEYYIGLEVMEYEYCGDGLVPKWSAALGGQNIYADKIYKCTGNGGNHISVLSNTDVFDLITGRILGTYVYTEKSNFKKGYS